MAERAFKFNIQFKFFLIIISIILFICSTIVFFFVSWTKNELYNEIEKRGVIEAKSLAHDARYGVITEDTVILDHLIAGRMVNPDIMCINITKYNGTLLTRGMKDKCFICDTISEKVSKTGENLHRKAIFSFNNSKQKIYLDKDVYRSGLISKNGNEIFRFTAPIITKRQETPEQEKIIEDVLLFDISESESPQITRGAINICISLANINKRVKDTLAVSVLIIFLVVVISITISLRFIKIITEPIKKVAQTAFEISRGDLTKSVDVYSSDEIGVMAENFNKMTTTLRRTINELEETKAGLEKDVDKRTAELQTALKSQTNLVTKIENANKELESFAYIVSHDLKAPLRGINSLATWIYTDYADKFDKNGKEHIHMLINRVKRMHNLIDGILKYSRTGQTKGDIINIDMNALIMEIVDLLNPPNNIEIYTKDELPTISYGKVHIEQVLQNLIGNAIKFIDKPKGKIIIGCKNDNDYWKFSVEDNGPGIDKNHLGNIFKIFQTLSPKDDLESTGIGLAIAKKIVEEYGGKIEVESTIGQGTKFSFSVPKNI